MNPFQELERKEKVEAISEFIATVITDILLVFIFMWSWNYIMPTLFSMPKIDFWQSLAIQAMIAVSKFTWKKKAGDK